VVTADQRRQAAAYLHTQFAASERRVCRLLKLARSTRRYQPQVRDGEVRLVQRMTILAGRHPRFGYRRIGALLRRDGWTVNAKRVRRLWRQAGFQRPPRRSKRANPGGHPGQAGNGCSAQPARTKNDVWAWDFIFDRTRDGGMLKWLTLVDEFTRECLMLRAARSMTSAEVVRELAKVVRHRGAPRAIRSDNGPEFIGDAIRHWLTINGVNTLYVAPASPWQNGFAESFHSRLRDEFLDREEFATVLDAQTQAAQWRHQYNTVRPHSALNYQTPQEFSGRCVSGGSTSLRSADPPETHRPLAEAV
jgi:putative transposase